MIATGMNNFPINDIAFCFDMTDFISHTIL